MDTAKRNLCSLISELVETSGVPTEGAFAETLWRHLSGNHIEPKLAEEFYLVCGYKPFKGYPLERLR